jgi:hypothetical protein
MKISINEIITFDIVASLALSSAKLVYDEELKRKKILEDMERRNRILDELLKED